MTPTPLLFSARNGEVIFDGKPVPEYRAIAVRQHLVAVALDRSAPEPRAEAFWRMATELRAALTASRDQRHTIQATAVGLRTVASNQVPQAAGGPDREHA